jgi:hypothetical protein
MKKVLLAFASLLMMGTLFAQVTVTFNVDMSTDSTFNPETQHVYISGSFVDWTQPGENEDYMLAPDDNNKIYTITMSDIPTGEIQYKYFIVENEPSWSGGEWDGDPNRVANVSTDTTFNDVWARLNTGIPAVELPQFSMYPNPVVNNLYLENIENANRVEIYNLVGQKVKEALISGNKLTVQTSDLTKGVYLISVINENGAVKSLKFVKR